MTNPADQLHGYLDNLITRFLNTKTTHEQLKELSSWWAPGRNDALRLGLQFFRHARYSMHRIVLVEIHSFISGRDDKSLVDWLRKAYEHAEALRPTRYVPRPKDEHVPIGEEEYRSIVKNHQQMLGRKRDLEERITELRHNLIAHFDSQYFDDPEAATEDHPVKVEEIDDLIDVISEILETHHLYLLGGDLSTEVHGGGSINAVLDYVRAFQRARQDSDLIADGFSPRKYLGDDYES